MHDKQLLSHGKENTFNGILYIIRQICTKIEINHTMNVDTLMKVN